MCIIVKEAVLAVLESKPTSLCRLRFSSSRTSRKRDFDCGELGDDGQRVAAKTQVAGCVSQHLPSSGAPGAQDCGARERALNN
mmetsp:Transcript_63641/g.148396  ORF Transcript_63641/g.148396 Transcript_63641/m.148396 type:complete len:83 (+) Transcript_63641:121-369(+)